MHTAEVTNLFFTISVPIFKNLGSREKEQATKLYIPMLHTIGSEQIEQLK